MDYEHKTNKIIEHISNTIEREGRFIIKVTDYQTIKKELEKLILEVLNIVEEYNSDMYDTIFKSLKCKYTRCFKEVISKEKGLKVRLLILFNRRGNRRVNFTKYIK